MISQECNRICTKRRLSAFRWFRAESRFVIIYTAGLISGESSPSKPKMEVQ
jgi:hypothetical protein